MEEDDVHELRDAGFSDCRDTGHCSGDSYYAYVNRLADGLGVELEEFWKEKHK